MDTALSGQQLQSMAIRGSIWTAVHAVTAVPLAFIANAIVARSLGVADYGSLALLTIAFAIANQVANGGFSDSLMRHGAASEARGQHAVTDQLLRRSFGFHVLIELPLLWCVALVLARDEPIGVVAALLVSSAMSCVFGGATLFLTLANRSAAGAKLAMVTNLLVQVAVAVTAVTTHSPVAVISARLMAGAALVPIALLAVPRARRRALLNLRLPRRMPTGFWTFAGQSFLAGLIGLLVFSRSEILLLGWLASPEAVGLFALAFGLSIQITAPVDAMLNPMAPAVTGILATRPDLAEQTLFRVSRFSSLLCALITGVLLPTVYFAVPWVYGDEFRDAAVLLLPLAAVSCVQSMGQAATAFAFARAHGGRILKVNVVALVVNIAAGIPLVIAFGVWGAVIANMASQLTSVLLLIHGELRLQAITWRAYLAVIRIWPLALGTALVTTGTVAWLLTDVHEALQCLAAGGLGLALVVGIGRVTRSGLDADDRRALAGASPRRTRAVTLAITGLFVHQSREVRT